jgi:hypothetical protein
MPWRRKDTGRPRAARRCLVQRRPRYFVRGPRNRSIRFPRCWAVRPLEAHRPTGLYQAIVCVIAANFPTTPTELEAALSFSLLPLATLLMDSSAASTSHDSVGVLCSKRKNSQCSEILHLYESDQEWRAQINSQCSMLQQWLATVFESRCLDWIFMALLKPV